MRTEQGTTAMRGRTGHQIGAGRGGSGEVTHAGQFCERSHQDWLVDEMRVRETRRDTD